MEILLIGNGFDLAHGLPTKYRDFLDFCQGVEILLSEDFSHHRDEKKAIKQLIRYDKKLSESLREDASPQVRSSLISAFYHINGSFIPFTVMQMEEDLRQRSALQELHALINPNTWIEYFMQRSSRFRENWIDFESEISSVIQLLDAFHADSFSQQVGNGTSVLMENAVRSLLKASNLTLSGPIESILREEALSSHKAFQGAATESFINFLNEELVKLIRALEIYISVFINNSTIERKNPDIDQLHPDHVLSFNYSDTYERVYGSGESIKYDYIHGKAELDNTKDSCNLVLGIDEYLDDDRKNTDLRFLSFKKFYQRIYKSTDSQYWNWIDEIKRNEEPSTLYIFGHSLDITDRDVLQALICCPHMQTKIFYYRESEDDKQKLGKLIRNLLLLLGQEELIRRTSGMNRTIEFIPQTITT